MSEKTGNELDEILSAIARLLGRVIGRNLECGVNCSLSELGWAEYLLLAVIFFAAFIGTRKTIHYFKHR